MEFLDINVSDHDVLVHVLENQDIDINAVFGNFVESTVTGNQIILLSKPVDQMVIVSEHSNACGVVHFTSESRMGLASCTKCSKLIQLVTFWYNGSNRFSVNVGAVLGTGGGAAHLEELLLALDVPSLHHSTFIDIERQLGSMFDDEVTVEIMEAGKEEKD